MKKFITFRFLPGGKGSIHLFLIFAAFLTGLTSCSKEDVEADSMVGFSEDLIVANATNRSAASGTVIEEIQFSAVAMIADCHGENIAFQGIIQNRVSKTTSASGQEHYTRSFTTRGMTGAGRNPVTGTNTGTEYDVIGGAEMFSVKNPVYNAQGMLNIPGSLAESDIFIHQGTLVFQNREDGSRVVARHIIRKVPGQDEIINTWVCAGK